MDRTWMNQQSMPNTPLHFTQPLVAASSRHNPSCHSCCLVRTHTCVSCGISCPSSCVHSTPCTHASSMLSSGWPRMHCQLGSNCQSFWDVVDEQWKPEGQEQLMTVTDLHMIGQALDAWGQKRLCDGLMKRHSGCVVGATGSASGAHKSWRASNSVTCGLTRRSPSGEQLPEFDINLNSH